MGCGDKSKHDVAHTNMHEPQVKILQSVAMAAGERHLDKFPAAKRLLYAHRRDAVAHIDGAAANAKLTCSSQ